MISPQTKTVMLAAARPIEEIHRTHDALATMTTHPISAPVKTGHVLSCDILSVTHRSRVHYCVPDEATAAVAELNSDWSTWLICENSTGLTKKWRTPWRNTTCVRSSLA